MCCRRSITKNSWGAVLWTTFSSLDHFLFLVLRSDRRGQSYRCSWSDRATEWWGHQFWGSQPGGGGEGLQEPGLEAVEKDPFQGFSEGGCCWPIFLMKHKRASQLHGILKHCKLFCNCAKSVVPGFLPPKMFLSKCPPWFQGKSSCMGTLSVCRQELLRKTMVGTGFQANTMSNK